MKRGIFILIVLLSLSFVSAFQISVTREHPFLVNGNWISASSLQVGQILENIHGKKVRITNIEDVKKDTSVFNIETSSNNYVVDNLIVHNSGGNPALEKGPLPGRGIKKVPDHYDGSLLLERDRLHHENLVRAYNEIKTNPQLEAAWNKLIGRRALNNLGRAINEHDMGKALEIYQRASHALDALRAKFPDCYRELDAWKYYYDNIMGAHSNNPLSVDILHHNPQVIPDSTEAVTQATAGTFDWFETATSGRLGEPLSFAKAKVIFNNLLTKTRPDVPLQDTVIGPNAWNPAQKFDFVFGNNNIQTPEIINSVEQLFKLKFPERFF